MTTSRIIKVISLTISIFACQAHSAELLSLKDYLKGELSTSAKMSKESFAVDGATKSELTKVAPDADDSSVTFYYGKNVTGGIEKACTVLPQKGKEGPLSVGVCFDVKGTITGVKILSHEEERGKKIEEEAFLNQFKGKKISDAFLLGKDVDGISGATWSSKAMAEVTRKAAFFFKKFVGEKK